MGTFYKNPPLQVRAIFYITLENFNKFAVVMTSNIEFEFNGEDLFRKCSVSTNLLTSLEFHPIHFATMMCYFEQTRSGSVATHFILLTSTATSIAIGGYVVFPDLFCQNEEPTGENKERTRKRRSFIPKSRCKRCSISLDF